MFGKFAQVVEQRHEYAQRWRERTGGKVAGYLCCYAPEEVLYAAGVLPVRVVSSHEPQDLSEPHIFGMFCPFSRDCLGEGLKGTYNYLQGLVMGQSCLHIRQAFAAWRLNIPLEYSRYINVPVRVQDPAARAHLIGELQDFRRSVEEWVGSPISDDALWDAIQVYNTNRRLLRQLYEMRKQDPPPLTGAEAMIVVEACIFGDKRELNHDLEELLGQLPDRRDRPQPGVRLMLCGGENHDPEVLSLVEGLGANIVIDDTCFGTRYSWGEAPLEDDPITALARRYLEKPPCPTKDVSNPRTRPDHILSLARDWNVRGAYLMHQKFCDPHEFDIPVIGRVLKENGIPSFFIELDTTLPRGQIRTRAEAFLEMLELELV